MQYSDTTGYGIPTNDPQDGNLNIYVYQIDDQTYGAGLLERVCSRRGKIVERWPIDDDKQIAFVQRHGSAFNGVRDRVKELADKAIYINEGTLDFDEEREALLIELSELPLGKRITTTMRILFRRIKCY